MEQEQHDPLLTQAGERIEAGAFAEATALLWQRHSIGGFDRKTFALLRTAESNVVAIEDARSDTNQPFDFTEEVWDVLEITRTAMLTFDAENQADDQTRNQETRYNVDFANQSLHLAMALAERGPINNQLEVYMLLIRSDIAFAMGDDRLSTSLAQQVQRRLEKIKNPQPPSFKTVVRGLGRLAQDGWQRRHADMTVAERERAAATQRFLGVYPKFAVESAATMPPQSPEQTTDSHP